MVNARKRPHPQQRPRGGFDTVQCECCSNKFPNTSALMNHRSLIRTCHDHYYAELHKKCGLTNSQPTRTNTSTRNVRTRLSPTGAIAVSNSTNQEDEPSPLLLRFSSNTARVINDSEKNPIQFDTDLHEEEDHDYRSDEESINSADFVEWEDSSVDCSSDEGDQNLMSEGIGTIEDLVKGIETSFDNTPLSQTIGEYNFDGSCDQIDNDSYTVEDSIDDDSSLESERNNEDIPIGGDAAMRAQISLLKIFEDTTVPIGLYDKIMDWSSEAHKYGYDFPSTPARRVTVLKNFSNRFHLHNIHAKETVIPLEGGGLGTITHFEFESMVKSLISDPRILESLIINWENPSKAVASDKSELSDVHTGSWFHNTRKKMCTELNHALSPIIFACDRAHCDEGGKSRLSLEPLLFTLAIIPEALRVHEWAWRPLGYLNNLHLAPSSEIGARLKGQNIRNTHRMLRVILSGVKDIQTNGGITFKFPQSQADIILKLPIAFVIGDCKGHDVLCGRYGSHSIDYLCRDCTCPLSEGDNHNFECEMRNVKDIQSLTDQEPTKTVIAQLQSIGQHYVRNAFYELDFGENPGSIHTATPIEMLHGLELGWFKYALKSFFELLTPTQTQQFDQLSKVFSDQHNHQSDRTFPRTSFPHGFSNVTRLQGHEYVGCLFLSVLVLSSRPWEQVMRHFSANKQRRLKQFLDLFQTLLSLHSFTKMKTLSKKLFRVPRRETECDASKAFRICVQKFKSIVRRKKGNGTKLTKVHQMLHLPYYISMYGCPSNWYGSPAESLHKHFVKKPGKNTQRRPDIFEKQAGKRVVESYIIAVSYNNIIGHVVPREKDSSRPIGGSRFEIHVYLNHNGKYIVGSHDIHWPDKRTEKRMTKGNIHFDQGAIVATIKSCYTLFDRSSRTVRIPCFTEHKVDGIIYHGHPLYRGKGQWHDYAYFQWAEVEYPIMSRIYYFVDLRASNKNYTMSTSERRLVEKFYNGKGLYAVTRSCDGDPKEKNVFICTSSLNNKTWYLPSVSAIDSPGYCVFDSLADEHDDNVMISIPPYMWGTLFLE